MLAVDTNVLVRYLVGDEPTQVARARDLIVHREIFVSMSVVLETEWVLRDPYGFSADRVHAALLAFAALPNVTIENANRLVQALDWVGRGLDLPDALHLASAVDCEAFATFDKAFAKRANRAQLGTFVKLI